MGEPIGTTHRLTRYMLWSSKETVESKQIPLPVDFNDEFIVKHKFILGIYAPSKEFLKVTSYYLDTSDVSKITFVFDKIDDDIVKKVSLVIKDIPESPIHVSGFCMKQEKYIYELYLKGKKDEAARIVALVQKHASSFQTKIEEISLNPTTLSPGKQVAGSGKLAKNMKPTKPVKS
jgi:hypothetical protein